MKKAILIFCTVVLYSFTINKKPLYYGEFRAIKMMNYYDTTLSSVMYYGMAYLFNNPSEEFSPANGTNDGLIKLNNRPLYYEQAIRGYLDSVERKTNQGINWSLNASTNLSNFSHTCLTSYPIFNGMSSIPNIITKSNNLVIPFNNLQGADEVEFTIDDYQMHIATPWYRKVNANIPVLIIPMTHLTALRGSIVTIRITFIKKEEKVFNGKLFKFENRLNINKSVVLNN